MSQLKQFIVECAICFVLNSEIEKVEIEEMKISNKVVVARADGKQIYDHVSKWQIELEEFRESSKEFSKRYERRRSLGCIKRLPIPNPVTRFQLGREAQKKTDRVVELTASGLTHLADEIAHLPSGEYVPKPDTIFQNFQSRKDVYGKLWKALTEGNSVIHGIYGMPGVGKTRMVEQLWEDAMKEKIFKKVTRADVGGDTLDVIKPQNQIAGYLDCHLESQDNTESRANQLRNSLLNGDKFLVILDDVWREIPLDAIGIPYNDSSNSKGCKILFTSRKKTVCLLNKCKHPVNITTLTFDEAMVLFRNIVGTTEIDSLHDDNLVQEVCKKCAGLPLLILAVGKALRFRSHSLWKDALNYLEEGNFENIFEINPQAYGCVRLSIDRLPDNAKLCLLLCSLFPEDADISIRMLITIAKGSQLIPDRESSIHAMVDILKSSSLALEGPYNGHIKLHASLEM
ncbi:hypothetical protein AgCh_001806 [Apium graveolens]